jgi:hypothetical protein
MITRFAQSNDIEKLRDHIAELIYLSKTKDDAIKRLEEDNQRMGQVL